MSVATFTHDEPITGEPHAQIRTPNPDFRGRRLDIQFVDGVGRTRDLERIRALEETFGYEVVYATGMTRLPEHAEPPKAERAKPLKREAPIPVVID